MKTILDSKLVGVSKGTDLDQPYRAVLIGGDKPLIQIEQHFPKSGNWGGCGRWYLETLTEDYNDCLSIDYGQHWSVRGMMNVLTEATRLLLETGNVNQI
jgi:hypothetical protein